MPSVTYHDPRHSDTYVVTLDSEGDFVSAKRYLIGLGNDPIVYESLADVPQPHKANIEQKISELQFK